MGGQEVPVLIRLDCELRSPGGLAGLDSATGSRDGASSKVKFLLLLDSARGVL